MQETEAEILFGKLAIHYQLASKEQVRAALELRRREGAARTIAEILHSQGVLSGSQVAKLRQVQQTYTDTRGATQAGVSPTASPEFSGDGAAAADRQKGSETVEDDRPVVPDLSLIENLDQATMSEILDAAIKAQASDVHVHAGATLRARIAGRLMRVSNSRLTPETSRSLVESILSPEQREVLQEAGQLDFAYSISGVGRFRANAYLQQRGIDAVFRVIPGTPATLDELNLPATLERFTQHHQGLVLVTGPAGCGKSSTLAALVRRINETRRQHVITIEDPIEYLHHSERSVVNQRQVGQHTASFPRALRAALREDPDVIVLGELRDLETISLALTAAETGHLVLGTLHTHDAIRTVNRLLGVFPHNQQAQVRTMVAEGLRGIVSQRLATLADGSGRVPALEILVSNKAVANLIRENKTFQLHSVLQTGSSRGMYLLDASLQALVDEGKITRKEAARHATDPSRFRKSSDGTVPVAPSPADGSARGIG